MWGLLQIPGSGWSRVGCALGDLEKVMTPSVGHFLGLKGRSVTKSSWGGCTRPGQTQWGELEGLRVGVRADGHQVAPEHKQSPPASPWPHLQAQRWAESWVPRVWG